MSDQSPRDLPDPAYPGLVPGVQDATRALLDAARAGDPDAAAQAVFTLKPPFAKLFARFG